jgi:predicted dehydrogenase
MSARPIRLGMVGGGEGAFIGAVHRMAARLDGQYELVAGALSSDAERARRSGAALGLAPDRCYGDFRAMAKTEARHADGIEAVAIVTPNHMHAPVALAFLKAGIHVICDKPLAATLKDARALATAVAASGKVFCVTYNYSGYAMVRQARAMVAEGLLGAIRIVQVEYAQDWLTTATELEGSKQASWRTDPAQAGAGCIGDIGTHAFHLAGFVTGLEPDRLCADLATFVPGRRVDDNAQILLRYPGGARGMLWASQVAPGNANNLRIRVYGETGGLEWRQEDPDRLIWSPHGEQPRLLRRGGPGLHAEATARIPQGHPEGYLEAFATVYTDAAAAIRDARTGQRVNLAPGVADGLAGVAFIHAAQRSAARDGAWIAL